VVVCKGVHKNSWKMSIESGSVPIRTGENAA
jgi:hypothetical protein